MSSKTKMYRRLSDALKAARDPALAIVQVGDVYVVSDFNECSTLAIIGECNIITGTVTLRHLERLGNANWATENAGSKTLGHRHNKFYPKF